MPEPSRNVTRTAGREVTAADVAGLLAAAATGLEPERPGPLSKAARCMARAAQSPADQAAPAGTTMDSLDAMAGQLIAPPRTGPARPADPTGHDAPARRQNRQQRDGRDGR